MSGVQSAQASGEEHLIALTGQIRGPLDLREDRMLSLEELRRLEVRLLPPRQRQGIDRQSPPKGLNEGHQGNRILGFRRRVGRSSEEWMILQEVRDDRFDHAAFFGFA